MGESPEDRDDDKQRKGPGKDEKEHRSAINHKTGEHHAFTPVEIEDSGSQESRQDHRDGKGREEEAGIVYALLQGKKGKEGGYGSPDDANQEDEHARKERRVADQRSTGRG